MIHSTIYDVAVRAGVSVATVSRTFAKPDIVTEATRKKVIEAANDVCVQLVVAGLVTMIFRV